MAKIPKQVTVNGQAHQAEVEPRMLLVHFIREVVRLEECERGKNVLEVALRFRRRVLRLLGA